MERAGPGIGTAVGVLAGLATVVLVWLRAGAAGGILELHRALPAVLVIDALPVVLGLAGLVLDRSRAVEQDLWRLRSSLGPWSDGALVGAVLDPAILLGPDGAVLAANPAATALFGRELTGSAAVDLVTPPLEPPAAGGRDHVVGGRTVGVVWPREARTADGVVAVHVAVVPATQRRSVWVLRPADATGADAAERTRLTAELAAAREEIKARSRFLSTLTHEMRTPLTAILGYAELLAEEVDDDARGDVEAVLTSARHLLALVNDVLDLSRLEAGRGGSVALDLVAVDALFTEVETTTRPLAARNGNTLSVERDPAVTFVRADALRLRQVLLNLVGNACKFTKDGSVRLGARFVMGDAGAGTVELEVTDTGIGMSPEQLARLFKDWVQADPDIRRRFGGTGLGLALSRRMTEAMGGRLTARSEAGVGSTFVVSLPWSSSTQRTIVPDLLGAASVMAASLRRPVVVYDQRTPAQRDRLEAALGEASLGPVAWSDRRTTAAAAVLAPRAIVVDGDDPFVSQLSADPAFARVPILSTGEPATEQPGASAPAQVGYVTAPLDAREIAVVLRRLERVLEGALVPAGDVGDRVADALAQRGWTVSRTPVPGRRYAVVVATGAEDPMVQGPAVVRVGPGAVPLVEDDGALADLIEASLDRGERG